MVVKVCCAGDSLWTFAACDEENVLSRIKQMKSASELQRLPNSMLFALPRFVSSFLNSAFVIIALPIVVLAHSPPEQKGIQLGILSALSVLLTIVTLLGTAHTSDILPGERVRRKPFIIAGHVLVLPAALLSLFGFYYLVSILVVLIAVAARSAIDAAHLPLLNDLIPERLRGRYSAPISLLGILGIALGAVLAGYLAQTAEGLGTPTSFLQLLSAIALVAALCLGAVFVFAVEEPARRALPSPLMELLRSRSGERESAYYRFMVARTVYLVGIFAVVIFFVYIVKDVYRSPDFKMMSGVYYAVSVLGAALFTLPAGNLADRIGCLPVIFICGAVQVVSSVVIFFLAPGLQYFAYAGIFFFGGAFGGIFAASLALSTKLIPRAGDAAKYMALLIVSTYVAQFFASLLGGGLFDLANMFYPGSGHVAIFFLAELCFLSGGVVFLRIKEPAIRQGGCGGEL